MGDRPPNPGSVSHGDSEDSEQLRHDNLLRAKTQIDQLERRINLGSAASNAATYLDQAGLLDLRDKLISAATLELIDVLAEVMENLRVSNDTGIEEYGELDKVSEAYGHNLKKVAGLARAYGRDDLLDKAAKRFVAVADEAIGNYYHSLESYERIGDIDRANIVRGLIKTYENEQGDEREERLRQTYEQRKSMLLVAYGELLKTIEGYRATCPALSEVSQEVDRLLQQ